MMNWKNLPDRFPEGFSAGDHFLVACWRLSSGVFDGFFTITLENHPSGRLCWGENGDYPPAFDLPLDCWKYMIVKLEIPGNDTSPTGFSWNETRKLK